MSGSKKRSKEAIMLMLWNEEAGLFVSPEEFETEEEANAYAKDFLARYAAQGYYLTARGQRIPVNSVRLDIVEVREP